MCHIHAQQNNKKQELRSKSRGLGHYLRSYAHNIMYSVDRFLAVDEKSTINTGVYSAVMHQKMNLRSLNIEADVERTGLWSAPWEKLSMGTKTPPLQMPRFCRAPRRFCRALRISEIIAHTWKMQARPMRSEPGVD